MPGRPARRAAERGEAAAERLRRSRRPVFVVGHGARYGIESVLDLAERLGAPVLTTLGHAGPSLVLIRSDVALV